MKRDLSGLVDQEFDLLIIGGGIHGCCAAREAARRGLRVALLEKNDFASGNSSNSLKIIHGGLRYLQNLDIGRMRASIADRRALLCLAPHLVEPLPCIMPTYGIGLKSRPILSLAMKITDMIGFDRNRGIEDEARTLDDGKTLSREETLDLLPGIKKEGVTGGAIWHDALCHNTERLVLHFLKAATDDGAVAANYLPVERLHMEGSSIGRVIAHDRFSGEDLEIRARMILSCSGPATDRMLAAAGLKKHRQYFKPSTAINLILKRQLIETYAAGLRQPWRNEVRGHTHRGSRVLFAVPWRGRTIIGTRHLPLGDGPNAARVTEDKIASFVSEVNDAWPGDRLERSDVAWWHWGILPMEGVDPKSGDAELTRHSSIVDHGRDGIENMFSIIGVKFTTGRSVARQAVLDILKKMQKSAPDVDESAPLPGGSFSSMEELVSEIQDIRPALDRSVCRHLARTYGSGYGAVLQSAENDATLLETIPGTTVTGAEVVYAIRDEMASSLADVVFRRTEIGTAGPPEHETLAYTARLMAKELHWHPEKIDHEMDVVEAAFRAAG